MDIFYLLTALISLITWIVIMVMASNISNIKNQLSLLNIPKKNAEYWVAQYHKNIAWNRKDEALYALQEFIWIKVNDTYYNSRKPVYDSLRAKHEEKIIELGGVFMPYDDAKPE
jgi:G:T-mismatch repair DNA endonuclease (very short patch repair protein)